MKYLKDKNSRRRGVAIELAVGLLLIMTAMSTIIVATTMIQVNKQTQSIHELQDVINEYEKIEYDQIGRYFEQLIIEEYEGINDNNDVLPISEENETYTSEKKTFLEDKLNTKFKCFKKDKDLSFDVTVIMKIKSTDSNDDLKNENNQIIQTHTNNYDYELIYTLKVSKLTDTVFESQYKINFKRQVTNISTQESVEEPIMEKKYYWLDELSSTIDNLNPLFTVQGGYKFQMMLPYVLNYTIEVHDENPENNQVNYVQLDEKNGILFGEVESDTEYICKVTYTVRIEETIPEENQPEATNETENGGDSNLEGNTTETKIMYFKVLVTKDALPTETEPSLVDEPVQEESTEEKTPANEEKYEIMLLKQIGVNHVPKEGTEAVITTNYKVIEKKLEKTNWKSK